MVKIGFLLVFFGMTALAGSLAAQTAGPLPPAPGVRLVQITPNPGFLNEPSIAVDPSHPKHLVAAWQINASVAWSRDGGKSWTTAAGTAPDGYKISGDVSTTYDDRGHAILCYIAFDTLGTTNYWGHNATRNGIFIRRSLDGGKSWEKNAVAVCAHATQPGIPFEDKPYIVADNTHSRWRGIFTWAGPSSA